MTIEPQIEVEYVEAALDLALRGLGDTIGTRRVALGARLRAAPAPRRLRPAARRHVRLHHPPQRPPLARHARVHGAGARSGWRRSRLGSTYMSAESQATVAEEEYLQTIFWLHEAGLPMTGANVARAMQLSAPTVHEMIGRLERDGYITRGTDRSLSLHRLRPRARRAHRPPPPADRALPHRRARDPVGRGARGGRAARARDVAGARGADVRRHRRRQDLPARPPDRAPAAASRACRSPTASPARRSRILRFENEAEELLHYLHDRGIEPGLEGTFVAAGRRRDHGRARRRARSRSRARSPRRSRWSPTRRRRRASRCPSSSCSPRTATGAEGERASSGRRRSSWPASVAVRCAAPAPGRVRHHAEPRR